MSLLGQVLRSYYAWLILGWLIGTVVLVGGAVVALTGHRVWDTVVAPSLAPATWTAERRPAPDSGYHYELTVENQGRQAATDCRATVRLEGTQSGSGAIIRVRQPVGWITPESEEGPDGLARSLTLPPGESRRLYLGHTTAVRYQFVFPDLPTAEGEVVRAGPGVEGAEPRRLSIRDLNETDWETARLELRPADAETARFSVDFDAELAAQDPRLRFGNGTSTAAESGIDPPDDAERGRDRAT